MTSRRFAIRAIGLALLLSANACETDKSSSPSTVADGALDGRPGCSPPSPILVSDKQAELRASASGGVSAYGLLMSTSGLKIRKGDELKIVWRVTGEGDLAVGFADPLGNPRALLFGPERHGGSSYIRPGDEWGTWFAFDRAGCWHITLTRGLDTAEAWLKVL
jgi:hypothetical protein